MDLLFLSEHLRNIAGDLLPQILVPLVQQSSGLTRNCWNLKRLFQINDCLDQPGPDCDDIVALTARSSQVRLMQTMNSCIYRR